MDAIEQVKEKQRALWGMGDYPRIAEVFLWGDREIAHARFAPYAAEVSFQDGAVTWEFNDAVSQLSFLTEAAPSLAAAKAVLPPEAFEELSDEIETIYRDISVEPPRIVYDSRYVIVIGTKKA